MLISTKGRYALRVLIDLAEQQNSHYIPLKEIAQRQNISQKYLEGIMTILSKDHLIDASHGKGGGYRLNRPPKDYKIGEILQLTEGTLAPVSCLEKGAAPCHYTAQCRTIPMWSKLNDLITEYLDSVSIEDLMQETITASDLK